MEDPPLAKPPEKKARRIGNRISNTRSLRARRSAGLIDVESAKKEELGTVLKLTMTTGATTFAADTKSPPRARPNAGLNDGEHDIKEGLAAILENPMTTGAATGAATKDRT